VSLVTTARWHGTAAEAPRYDNDIGSDHGSDAHSAAGQWLMTIVLTHL
jgi:hypothetical protein